MGLFYIFLTPEAETLTYIHNTSLTFQFLFQVILPNVQLRENDEEQFEDNPDEYIRRDLEGKW